MERIIENLILKNNKQNSDSLYFGDQIPKHLSDKWLDIVMEISKHPTAPVDKIQEKVEVSFEDIFKTQQWIQKSNLMKTVMQSHYYPGYLFTRYLHSFFEDLVKNPDKLERIENGQVIGPNRLEIHVTNASCNYRCKMCLWHVKEQAMYDLKTEKVL